MIDRQEAIKQVQKEGRYWKEAYPNQAELIKSFTQKIVVELKLLRESTVSTDKDSGGKDAN